MRIPEIVLAGVVSIASQMGAAWAQGAGTLRGQVTDPSGKSIPDAVVVLHSADHAPRSARTDLRGQYQFGNVVPGAYGVRASAKGFAASERPGYEVKAGAVQVLDFPLALATTAESVTV
jgi:Carboxypeptidase regulatory-like domain